MYATRYPMIAERAAANGSVREFVEQAQERLERAPVNTLSSNVPGLVPPRHIAQIMDLINASRPVVNSGRQLALDRGTLTYPKIAQRPEVLVQASEKTEGGTKNLQVTLETLTAETYLGGGDISWQAMNWSSPDTLQLWFDLAAEAYARATESAACEVLESAAIGTVGTASGRLGTAGTESFSAWRSAAIAGISAIYTATGGRGQTDTLYLAANRFFQLAGLGTDQTLQVSSVGALDIGSMTGTWAGLRVVGSYGFDLDTAIVGDSDALLVAETPGAPVQLRVVEPSIAGMEVGIVGRVQERRVRREPLLQAGHQHVRRIIVARGRVWIPEDCVAAVPFPPPRPLAFLRGVTCTENYWASATRSASRLIAAPSSSPSFPSWARSFSN